MKKTILSETKYNRVIQVTDNSNGANTIYTIRQQKVLTKDGYYWK